MPTAAATAAGENGSGVCGPGTMDPGEGRRHLTFHGVSLVTGDGGKRVGWAQSEVEKGNDPRPMV